MVLLYFISFLLIWQFVGYPILMALVAIKSKPKNKDYSYQPFVSILVPTYNESQVIRKRIENLIDLNYPKDKYEIIVVDSGSTDDTSKIVKEFSERNKNPLVKFVEEGERRGKASAINFGKRFAKGEIILVTDANSIFDKNVLREIMPHFKDPKVGAVGGRFIVMNPDDSLASSTQFYWDLEYIMRRGERVVDSACLFHGEINAWRKDIVDADTGMLSEDLDMAIQIRKKGYRIEYEPKAVVYEPAPTTVEDQIRQRKRTSIGTIQNLFKHWKYFLLPRDWYSFLIFPSHKTLTMFSPFLLIATPLIYLLVWDIKVILLHLLLTILVFSILLYVTLYLRGRLLEAGNPVKRENHGISFLSLFKIAYYVLLNEYLILLAWKDFILRRYSVLWEKAKTTRT